MIFYATTTFIAISYLATVDAHIDTRIIYGTTSFDIMWYDHAEFGFSSYEVTVSEVTFSRTSTPIANNSFMTIKADGLTPGTEYVVKIQGVTSTGQRYNPIIFPHLFTIPLPPTNGQFTEVNATTITLSWQPPESGHADGYRVFYDIETQNPHTYDTDILPANQLTYTITGLSPGNAYVLWLVSYSGPIDNFSDLAEILQQRNSDLIINRDNNGCALGLCQNGGKCFGETGSQYRCECINGFTGTNCETSTTLPTLPTTILSTTHPVTTVMTNVIIYIGVGIAAGLSLFIALCYVVFKKCKGRKKITEEGSTSPEDQYTELGPRSCQATPQYIATLPEMSRYGAEATMRKEHLDTASIESTHFYEIPLPRTPQQNTDVPLRKDEPNTSNHIYADVPDEPDGNSP